MTDEKKFLEANLRQFAMSRPMTKRPRMEHMEDEEQRTQPIVTTWDFTLFAGKASKLPNPIDIRAVLKSDALHWCFQLEKCPTTGNPHYQGRIRLRDKKRRSGVVLLFTDTVLQGADWRPTTSVNSKNFNYQMKRDTRIEGPWCDTDPEPMPQTKDTEIIDQKGFLPWQGQVYNDCKRVGGRTINYIIDKKGNKGKTTFLKWMVQKKFAEYIPPLDNMKELVGFAIDFPSNAYIIDMPRALTKKNLKQFWSAIETIKSGIFFDTRYKGRRLMREPVQIWIFANTEPDFSTQTVDRWRVWDMQDDFTLTLRPVNSEGYPTSRTE